MSILASPVFLLSSALATLWASFFHLFFGRKVTELLVFWFTGLIGFAAGQVVGDLTHLHWLVVGQVQFLSGSLGCWAAMAIAYLIKVW